MIGGGDAWIGHGKGPCEPSTRVVTGSHVAFHPSTRVVTGTLAMNHPSTMVVTGSLVAIHPSTTLVDGRIVAGGRRKGAIKRVTAVVDGGRMTNDETRMTNQ